MRQMPTSRKRKQEIDKILDLHAMAYQLVAQFRERMLDEGRWMYAQSIYYELMIQMSFAASTLVLEKHLA